MQELFQEISKRASVFVIITGAVILLIGAADGIVVNTFSLKFPDVAGRLLVIIAGIVLIGFGFYLELQERGKARNITTEQAANGLQSGLPANAQLYFDKPLLISYASRNRLKINSGFINWEQCTIMIWVLVTPKGEKLRESPEDYARYLLAHQTGSWNSTMTQWVNLFALRYAQGRWQVALSNNKAEGLSPSISVEDGLASGWHHFLVTWSRAKSELSFWIDGDEHGSKVSQSFHSHWPEKLSDEVTVGAWTMDGEDYSNRYCETQLYRLLIVPQFLKPSDPLAKGHLRLRPTIG